MLLKNLISNLKPNLAGLKIKGISFDSRNTKKGDLFVSVKGNKFDGNNYIKRAISKGAKLIIHSKEIKKNKKIQYLKVKNTREILAILGKRYYKKKTKKHNCSNRNKRKNISFRFFSSNLYYSKSKSGFYWNTWF